jgi:hypothetical protein
VIHVQALTELTLLHRKTTVPLDDCIKEAIGMPSIMGARSIFVFPRLTHRCHSSAFYFSNDDKLYRTAFVYKATVRILQSATFAPYSIIPTFLAIGVSLWWQIIDKTFRRLQPYLAMSKQPVSIKHSSALSYQSSYLAWAAVKAAMHKHWLLAVITIGSTICQIRK